MRWINFLHIYQPANSDAHVIKEATEKSYKRIIRALEEHPQIKFTINISGCLFLRWEELGYQDIIKRIGRLIDRGQIELTGTAAYHPIIPLIPVEESRKQINENEKILKKHFGNNFKPKGFFLPEMAYSPGAAKIIKELGYEWLILDEIAVSGKLNRADTNRVYKDKNSGLKIAIRSRKQSNTYVPEMITKILKKKTPGEQTVITATDGELYGLRYIDHTGEFEKLLKNKEIKTLTISDYIGSFKDSVKINPNAHSWETTEKELEKKEPFDLWQGKTNTIQKKLWQLAKLAYNTIEDNNNDSNYSWARWHLVRGLASCTFWWASRKDFSRAFGPLAWNPDEIERGTNELIRSVRALEKEETRSEKIKAEKLYIAIKKMVWEKHWVYYWKKS